jgi:diguanylate cyclase (GGDEF)-like protein/PAS domain S-box-containing protein
MSKEIKLLLVNSDSDIRRMLRDLLEKSGFHDILEASCSLSACQFLRENPIDLLITDIEVPGLDGWRLARLVRAGVFKCRNDIPIIVVAKTWCERIAETTAREFGVNAMIAMEHHERLGAIIQKCLEAPAEVLRNPCVLVVEDNPDTAQIAKRVLQHRFDVELAMDGLAGLQAWLERRHDLVLLDTMLPGMAGPEVLQEILKVDPNQPVVIMTAFSTVELAEDLMLKGAADFIAKPFLAEQLRRVCELAAKREDYLVSHAQFAERVKAERASTLAYRKISEAHQRLLDNLSTVVLELNQKGELEFLSQAWTSMTGYPIEESLRKPLASFLPPEAENWSNWLQPLLTGKVRELQGEMRLQHKQGNILWIDFRLDAGLPGKNGLSIFGTLDDISERKKTQTQLEFLTMHDRLTGLYNRHYFDGALRRMAATSARGTGNHALLYIDIDHFKVINDNYGHQRGDAVLREISELLLERLRQSDVLCRLGGDEFAILVPNTDTTYVRAIADEMASLIQNHQIRIDDQVRLNLSCSIGISEINGSAESPEEYLKQADIALYVAKRRGRNRIQVYDPRDKESEELRKSLDWARHLRLAIEEDGIVLHFQPIMHIATGQISYYEALVRLQLPGRGLAFPGEFIPALEMAGEMALLDHNVIKKALELLKQHPSLGRIAINLSAQAFSDEELVPLIEKQLRLNELKPQQVMFEVTESASISNITAAQRMIHQLNELGCEFAVDDFGTGFSTFGFLKQFPADTIKVDGSFISHLDRDPIDQVLVRSISEVARQLGKETVAEFVSSESLLNIVKDLGIDYAQGYFIGHPQPVEDLIFSELPHQSSDRQS